jgi:hypothetical protein
MVAAWEFSEEIEEWCDSQGIEIHSQNDVVSIENDGNPLWEWLSLQGLADNGKTAMWVAILGD